MESVDFSNDHLLPTSLGDLSPGSNLITGSLFDNGGYDSDAFLVTNPHGYRIDAIHVRITDFQFAFSSGETIGRLPGVILLDPNRGGSVPTGNGMFRISTDYDETGNLFLDDVSQLAFSVCYDPRPELLVPGAFGYQVEIVASIPEVSSTLVRALGISFILLRRRGHRAGKSM